MKILDIGCGSGMQTLALAKICPDGMVTAIEVHQPFLDDLILRAKKAGSDRRIVTHRASMDNLPFNEASFDIIWSEGSAFIRGLSPALRYWKKFLQPEGYLVVSDCTWFTDVPSDECRAFLGEECPDMKSVPGTEDIIRSAGYMVIRSFRLPDAGWWDHYYTPSSKKLTRLKEIHRDNDDTQTIIKGLEKEMEIHRKYSKEYGYTFFVLKNSLRPEYAEAWYNRGVALGALGRYAGAVASYDRVIAINPDDASAWYSRGHTLRCLGRLEEADASHAKAVALDPGRGTMNGPRHTRKKNPG